ncbi:MAG: 2-hydroxyacid dehydrogenase [Cytophagales bacterium]|nr:2-hydroxyacid dehydrogenase [Bernardetiaceae bacterium]MDW8204822.1 2-hydroxyacid dehydrogenase [Cytophagales bacterium]
MKVFCYSLKPFERPGIIQANHGKHELIFSEQSLALASANLAEGCEAVSIFTNDDASGEVLKALHRLGVGYVATRSAGYNHIDLAMARRLNMRVANVPAYSPHAVAEHGVAMLMALNRRIVEGQALMHMQDFRLDMLTGFNIYGKTVGIIGTGQIGIAFAKIMHGFGARLLGSDPQPNPEADKIGLNYVPLEDLLRQSDIISIHCPLNEHTKYLLDEPQFAIMKQGVYLVNTARGGIVRTAALIRHLASGKVGGACLDVYERENGLFFSDHRHSILQDEEFIRLRSFKNVLVTGHQGFLTVEALRNIADTTIANLDAWEQHGHSPNDLQD